MAKLFQLHRNFYLQNVGMNWANTMNSMDGGAQKSLAEIQAEEARQDRERQERERREKKARQKDLSLAQASVWGSASSNLSWANKTSSVSNFQQVLQQQPAAPPQQVLQPSHSSSSIGFWDNNDPPPAPKPQPQQAPPPQQQNVGQPAGPDQQGPSPGPGKQTCFFCCKQTFCQQNYLQMPWRPS